jgi:signal transduction histidine kinase
MKQLGVLLIDSDRAEREKNARNLSEARYAVLQAGGWEEAEAILKRHRGRLAVLSELSADGRSGLDFLKQVLLRYPFVPFTFLAASPSLELVIQALQRGAYDFLRKPVAPDILCHSVGRSLQKLDLTLETERKEKEIRHLLERSRQDLRSARNLSTFKGFMISMAAHDFRSIITVLDGYLQFIQERCRGCSVSDSGGLLEQAKRTIGRLRTMANTLLDYEAAETGRIHLDHKPFCLREALLDCIAFYNPYAEQKEIVLALAEGGGDVIVRGDRDKVMEILDNLLYNALKFTPTGGTIRLSGKKEDGFGTVCVQDTGVGMDKDKLKSIFEQEEAVATVDANARIGLGLTICKRLVEAQNGKIWIKSVKGKGTQVCFSLPAADQ